MPSSLDILRGEVLSDVLDMHVILNHTNGIHLVRLQSLFRLCHTKSPSLGASEFRVKTRTKHFGLSCQRCDFILQRSSKCVSKLSFSVATVTSAEKQSFFKFVPLDVDKAGKEHF